MLSALKHRFKNVLTPPHLTIYHAPMLSVAAIHATLLAIFLGVLSTYGFYRRTVSDQLEAKLKQEAHEINTIRFKTDDYIPKQAITEAKHLRESTPLPDLVEKLRVIILYGENVKSPYSVSLVPDNEVATLGRDAFHFMLALVLHSPFPDAMESRSDPSPIPFPDITTIESWVGELEQVTTPLIRAYESARSGLSKVLQHYSLQNAPEPLSPEYISFHAFSEPFFKNLDAAHEIRDRVKKQLQEIDRHRQSGIKTRWLLGGFLGASLTFVIGVLTPLHNFPISRYLVFWEPTGFYLLVLGSIAYLIFI